MEKTNCDSKEMKDRNWKKEKKKKASKGSSAYQIEHRSSAPAACSVVTLLRRPPIHSGTDEVIIYSSNWRRPINKNDAFNGLWSHWVAVNDPVKPETHKSEEKQGSHPTQSIMYELFLPPSVFIFNFEHDMLVLIYTKIRIGCTEKSHKFVCASEGERDRERLVTSFRANSCSRKLKSRSELLICIKN